MRVRKLLIVDGYTDEPAGLGVPPYIDVYPREIYGAAKLASKDVEVRYVTIDQVRSDWHRFAEMSGWADLVVVVAGALVPGRYLAGEPLRSIDELERMVFLSSAPLALTGPASYFGVGGIGGTKARRVESEIIKVKGRPAGWVFDAVKEGIDRASEVFDYELVSKSLIRGAEVVVQHPNYTLKNLVVELETYSGCSRGVVGGCSFCITHMQPIKSRPIEDVVAEVEVLYKLGVKSFRIGRQSDILVYGSPDLGNEEWPKPSPESIEKLFKGIRHKAPSLMALHIDNVNPGTISRWPEESKEVLKNIVKYHTPGDVAALGIESVDPKVIKLNNLKVDEEGAFNAIKIINEVGAGRGWNGLPHLLPGINFIAGLPGESKETWQLNKQFLERIEREGLLVRRVNLRKLSLIPGSKVSTMISEVRPARGYTKFKNYVMEWQERMMRKIVPKGTVLRNLMIESVSRGVSYARYPGSYPLTVELPRPYPIGTWISARVKRHHARSVVAEPL